MTTSNLTTGWPDDTNTGVPLGLILKASGSLVITQAGAVISGLDISGTVTIEASNVTLINCKITGATQGALVHIASGVTGTIVENCTINGTGANNAGSNGIWGAGTFIGNNIYNVENGISLDPGGSLSGPTVIQDNYIHTLLASGSPHYDGIQIDGEASNITISHNTIINSHNQTSAIMIDNYFGAVSNVTVSNNLLGGGGYTIYDDAHFNSNAISGVSITNNHIAAGQWGATDFNGSSPSYTGTVSDGAALIATLDTAANDGSSAPAAPVIASWSPDTGVVGDGVTNHAALTLTGTAVANSAVAVFDGSTQVATATANSSGQWTATTSALSNGAHSLTATDTSSAGTSVASAVLTVTVDTHTPAAPALTAHTIVNGDEIQLSGTAEANSTIVVHDGTTQVGTAVTNASGSWSVTTSALANGAHALTETATDAAGTVSAASQPLSVTFATAAPGWSDATNTGVPAGVTLTSSGSLVITKAGTVISGLNITGTVTIEAANVTLIDCKITGAGANVIQIASGITGTTIEYSEINGTGTNNAGSTGINGQGTFIGDNIYNVANGINVTGASVIQNNYIHNLQASGSQSYDGIKIDGGESNVTISHNTIINSHSATAAIMIDNYYGAVSNIAVSNNIIAGGGYTIYDDAHFNSSAITGVSITNNHIAAGVWGATDFVGTSPTYTGNASDGAALIATLNTPANDGPATTTASASVATNAVVATDAASVAAPPATVAFADVSVNSAHTATTVTGTADADSHVNLYDGATEIGSVSTGANGGWTFTTGALSSATVHTLTAQEVNSAGAVVGVSSGEAIIGSAKGGNVLTSGSGDDILVGNGPHDTFVFAANFGHDVIKDFIATGAQHDTIQFSASEFSNFASILAHASQIGHDVVIESGHDVLTLKSTKLADLNSHDFHFA